MRRLVYDVAASLDGFIAGPGEALDGFLTEGDHVEAYWARMQGYDTVVMGRKTYEIGYSFGMKPGDKPYPHMAHHVFSRSLQLPEGCGIDIVRDDWLGAIDRLKAADGLDIYLCGGGVFAGYLLAHQRLDRVRVKLNPVVLGGGTPLFEGAPGPTGLRLEAVVQHASGVALLDYAVGG